MFPKYPYLDLSDRNLDFLTKAIREMEEEVKNFVSLNAVKYADPIQWNITKQYEKNTIVIDPLSGTAFISVKPVPIGISLTRTEYWTPVFDLSQFVTKAASNFANSYERDITTTATVPTNKDSWVVWNTTLYKALNDIHIGDAYVVNGNIAQKTVEDFVNEVISALNNETTNRENEDIRIELKIDDLIASEARARAVEDIRIELKIDDLIASEARARTDEDVRIDTKIDNLTDKVNSHHKTFTSEYAANTENFARALFADALQTTGTITYLCNAANHYWTAIVTAIDSTHGAILLSSYTTATNNGYAGAWTINPNGYYYNTFATDLDVVRYSGIIGEFYRDKKILIIGDSLATASRVWAQKFTAYVNAMGATVTNWATSGWTTEQILTDLQSKPTANYDLCIVWSGTNDWNSHVMPGNTFGLTSGTYGYYLQQIMELLVSSFGDPETLIMSIPFSVRPNVVGKHIGRREWNRMAFAIAKRYGATYLDLLKAPLIGTSKDPSIWMNPTNGDYNHFNSWYQDEYLWFFITKSFADKNDGLVGVSTTYTVNNLHDPFLTDILSGVDIYRVHLTVNDAGFANLSMIINTTSNLAPVNNTIAVGKWNLDVFANENTPIQIYDSNSRVVYQGVISYGRTGEIRILTDATLPSSHTYYILAANFRTNLTPWYAPSNL